MLYDILKALHIIVVVTWFAGLFYLPRLFVYHVRAPQAAHSMLVTMEQKLLRFIMMPSLILVWVFGLSLLMLSPSWLHMGWLHAKFLLVLLLTGYHMSLITFAKAFATNTNTRSEKFYRLYNEIPSVLLILIVFLVVLKPF